jgi:hypothetical protein
VVGIAVEQVADTVELPVRQAEQAVEGLFRDGTQRDECSPGGGRDRRARLRPRVRLGFAIRESA